MRVLKWLSGKFNRFVLGDAASAARQVRDTDACLVYTPRALEGAVVTRAGKKEECRIIHLWVLQGSRSTLPPPTSDRREMAAASLFGNELESQEAAFLNARLRKRLKI